MRKGTQFKIESIEELKEAYENLKDEWCDMFTLENEISEFKTGARHVIRHMADGCYFIDCSQKDYETIPNPFKKEKPEPFLKALNDFHKATESMKTLIKVAEWAKERNELRKELKALREEVEKLKGELNLIKEQELAKEKQEAINQIHEIMRESLATKECCKEKPKESPEQKGFIRLSRDFDSIQVQPEDGFARLSMNSDSIMLDRDHVKRLVNYLKKHFEI